MWNFLITDDVFTCINMLYIDVSVLQFVSHFNPISRVLYCFVTIWNYVHIIWHILPQLEEPIDGCIVWQSLKHDWSCGWCYHVAAIVFTGSIYSCMVSSPSIRHSAAEDILEAEWWCMIYDTSIYDFPLPLQHMLICEINLTCPETYRIRWHTLFNATSWLDDHPHKINDHYSEIQVGFFWRDSQHENDVLWILNAVTRSITSSIHVMVMWFQDHTFTLSQQRIYIQ